MKTLFVLSLNLVFAVSCFAQTKTDNLDSKKQISNTKVVFRCGTSISNNDTRPLLVVDGVVMEYDSEAFQQINPKDIESIKVLKDSLSLSYYGYSGKDGVVLITTKSSSVISCEDIREKETSFKIHKICNTNWVTTQDVYNALRAKVPGIQISTSNNSIQTPRITLRGDDNTIVIVDGVRYNASILNTLNPNDIESIKVAPSVAATNYFRNGIILN